MSKPNRAYIDYLRLGTWNDQAYLRLVSKIRPLDKGWRPAKWLQYAGQKSDHMFYGVGLQGARRHYIIQCSGELAQMFYEHSKNYAVFFCSRIDIQRTIELPEHYEPLKLYEELNNDTNNRRVSSVILSSSGSTVYMGSRTSDTFVRVYEKELGDTQYLRFEFEIKGNTALNVYDSLLNEQYREGQIFDSLIHRFKVPTYLLDWFIENNEMTFKYESARIGQYKNNKLAWLSSLGAAIIKMGRDHDTGQIVKSWLESWLEAIDETSLKDVN